MIAEIVFLMVGLILSIYGLYHLVRSKKQPNDYKKFGTCAYVGLALFVFFLILIFQLHKMFNLLLLMVMVSIVFIILGKILLSSWFEKD